jgi:hypothetical protein
MAIERSSKNKDWIVFRLPDGSYDAIHNKHDGTDYVQDIVDAGNTVMCFCQFEKQKHAIDYMNQLTY